jgi:hypothetical protein
MFTEAWQACKPGAARSSAFSSAGGQNKRILSPRTAGPLSSSRSDALLAVTTASTAPRDNASQPDTLSVSRWPAARADVTRRSPFVANLGVRRRDRPPVAGDRSRRSHRRQSFSAARQARHTSRQRTRESTGTRDRTSKSRAGGSAASVSGAGSATAAPSASP